MSGETHIALRDGGGATLAREGSGSPCLGYSPLRADSASTTTSNQDSVFLAGVADDFEECSFGGSTSGGRHFEQLVPGLSALSIAQPCQPVVSGPFVFRAERGPGNPAETSQLGISPPGRSRRGMPGRTLYKSFQGKARSFQSLSDCALITSSEELSKEHERKRKKRSSLTEEDLDPWEITYYNSRKLLAVGESPTEAVRQAGRGMPVRRCTGLGSAVGGGEGGLASSLGTTSPLGRSMLFGGGKNRQWRRASSASPGRSPCSPLSGLSAASTEEEGGGDVGGDFTSRALLLPKPQAPEAAGSGGSHFHRSVLKAQLGVATAGAR